MVGRLLIASNRLPFSIREDRGRACLVPAAEGLTAALRGTHEQSNGRWFGWAGDLTTLSSEERGVIEAELRGQRAIALSIGGQEWASHESGFSHGILWPLFHYLVDELRPDAEQLFHIHQHVSRRFAETIAKEHKPGDLIWIHDYQLALVPGYLRRLLPDAVIGFSLHVPFPSAEVFRILPFREALLRGLLGADLLGFPTASYRYNFAHATALVLGLELGTDALTFDDRTVRMGLHPMGVDATAFELAAAQSDVATEIERLRREAGQRRILLGVDRLDRAKGIPQRLRALDRHLRRDPAAAHHVELLQVAAPPHGKMDGYSELRRVVVEQAVRLEQEHATSDGSPVQLLRRSVPFTQLVAMYRAADVMLATPLRDGGPVTAKEFVASRIDDRGVLVLSELAGAADELPEALIVNPYDAGSLATAIDRALGMREDEQRLRMSAMRARVRRRNVHTWTEVFLEDLRQPTAQRSVRVSEAPVPDLVDVLKAAQQAPCRVVLLDYDGTLVPHASLPELAAPDIATLDLLRALAATPHTDVHVLTNRTRGSIEQWLGALPVVLHAEDGFWSRWDRLWVANRTVDGDWKANVEPLLSDFALRTPGAFIEEKTASLTLHYRSCDPTLVRERLRELRPKLASAMAGTSLETWDGSKVLEVRMTGATKGSIARKLLADSRPDAAIIAAGDDKTDEEIFVALPERAICIRVGEGRTRAAHRVESPRALREMLRALAESSS